MQDGWSLPVLGRSHGISDEKLFIWKIKLTILELEFRIKSFFIYLFSYPKKWFRLFAREGRALWGAGLSSPRWGVVGPCHDVLAACSCLCCVLPVQLCQHNCLSVLSGRWAAQGFSSISTMPLCSSGAVAAESQGPAPAWEYGLAASWSRVLPELHPQWPEQRKAVAPLKDKYHPWPRENTGELILEVCNEKVFLYLLRGNWEWFLPMSAFL